MIRIAIEVFVSVMLFAVSVAEIRTRKVSAVVCTFKDKTYSPGDSWHPYLEPFGFMFCMQCACTETGHVKCKSIRCPALQCENPVTDPQQCCPRCTDAIRIPAGLRAPVKSCRHNGSVYQPGETFTKVDLFPSRQKNQCVLCTCSNGNIFCAIKTCQKMTCSTPVSVADTCCLSCKDVGISAFLSAEEGSQQLNRGVRHSVDKCAGQHLRGRSIHTTPPTARGSRRGLSRTKLNLKGASETTVKILLQKKHQRACLYSGNTYSHGDMWHPVLGKVLECILCTCKDGIQECKRITCPSQFPCPHPMKTDGKCCKTCPDLKSKHNQTLCSVGHDSNLLVYKVELASKVHTEDTVKIITIERQSTAEVEVQMWKTVGGVLQLITIEDAEKKVIVDHPENYTLLTTLDEETWRRFKDEGVNLSGFSRTTICENGIRDIVMFLDPGMMEDLCSP